MRKGFLYLVFALICGVGWAVNSDNQPPVYDTFRLEGKTIDDQYLIKFSTTVPANTVVTLLPNHWGVIGTTQPLTWPSGITVSTNPAKMNGGRAFLFFQAEHPDVENSSVQKLYYDFGVSASSVTSPFLTEGQTFPPANFPVVYQSTVTVFSTGTYKISGYVITEKSRR